MSFQHYISNLIQRKLNKLFYKGSDDYSQLGEQMVIMNILGRMDPKKINPIYIDIGAYHPYKGSNTYKLYLKNWKGVIVDPNPNKTKPFPKFRPADLAMTYAVIPDHWNMDSVQMVANHDYDACESINPELNTNNHLDLSNTRHQYTAQTIKISEVLRIATEKFGLPSFMSVDIEGLEGELLTSCDFKKYPIALLCIEHFLNEFTDGLSIFNYQESPLIQALQKQGYELVSVCGVSVILAHRDSYIPYG